MVFFAFSGFKINSLVTSTDSEVLCLLVDRWMGQGGKTSSANTTDDDILQYILDKLVTRIVGKSRTFLVMVKAYRGEPLNEGVDDLEETDRSMEKEGDNYRWKERTKTIRSAARRGEEESLLEERLQLGANKW